MADIQSPSVHVAPPPNQFRAGWPLVGGLLLLGVALLGIWYLRPAFPGARSPDVTFARNMAAHHEQAVAMALMIQDRTEDQTIQTMARDIVLTQQAQIGQMQGWLAVWGQPIAGEEVPMAGHGQMMGLASEVDVASLRTLPVADAETRFLQLMIQHHRGGMEMAQQALQETTRPEVERLATSIVNAQQNEITYMQELLTQRGVQPETTNMSMP